MKFLTIVIFSLTIMSCKNTDHESDATQPQEVLVNYPSQIDSLVYDKMKQSIEFEKILHFETDIKHPKVRKNIQKGEKVKMGDWKIDSSEYIVKAKIIFKTGNDLKDSASGTFSVNAKYEILWQEIR